MAKAQKHARELMPHGPPMLFIDSAGLDGDEPVAFTVVKPDWVILDEKGQLSGAAYFEIMAQGYGAASALLAMQSAEPHAATPTMGFLVGVKRFSAGRPALPGEALVIRSTAVIDVGPFRVFEASVFTDQGELLASGQIKIVVPAQDAGETSGFGEF